MNWLQYLLEANLYLGVFYLCYCLFLNRETYYMLNRAYLLAACFISFAIPVIQLGILKHAAHMVQTVVLITPVNVTQHNSPVKITPPITHFSMQDGLLYFYLLGVTVFMFVLVIKLYQLIKLTRTKPVSFQDNYKLIYINGSNTAFSFFNYLFIGSSVSEKETIIRHELVHIRQKHSVDIIVLELFKIISWFNPLIYLLQNSLKTVHEYIADEKTAVADVDTITYSAFLVNNAYGLSGSSITHSFFNYNLLKKRIIMLNQKRSGSLARLKYLIALPLCAGLLCASTLGFSKTYGWVDIAPRKVDTTSILPPPPPAPPALKNGVKFKLSSPFSLTTKKGYKYAESAYMVNGKSYLRVIIEDSKNIQKEYWKNKVSPAEIKMLRIKYGYTFPTLPIYPKLPPPPPVAIPAIGATAPVQPIKPHGPSSVKAFTPPVAAAPVSAAIPSQKMPPPPPPVMTIGMQKSYAKLPPPIVMKNEFEPFSEYFRKAVKYPKQALESKITGNIIAQFDLDDNHKITNIVLVKGMGNGCGEEVINAFKSYPQTINEKPGTYKIAVMFYIYGLDSPKGMSSEMQTDPQFIGETVVVGYLPTK